MKFKRERFTSLSFDEFEFMIERFKNENNDYERN